MGRSAKLLRDCNGVLLMPGIFKHTPGDPCCDVPSSSSSSSSSSSVPSSSSSVPSSSSSVPSSSVPSSSVPSSSVPSSSNPSSSNPSSSSSSIPPNPCPVDPCEWIWLGDLDPRWIEETFNCDGHRDDCICDDPPSTAGDYEGERRVSGTCHQ